MGSPTRGPYKKTWRVICFLIWLFRSLAIEILPGIAFHELLQVQLPIIVLVNSLENVHYFSWILVDSWRWVVSITSLGIKIKTKLSVATCLAHFENLLSALPRACNGLWVPILVVSDHTFKHFSMLPFGQFVTHQVWRPQCYPESRWWHTSPPYRSPRCCPYRTTGKTIAVSPHLMMGGRCEFLFRDFPTCGSVCNVDGHKELFEVEKVVSVRIKDSEYLCRYLWRVAWDKMAITLDSCCTPVAIFYKQFLLSSMLSAREIRLISEQTKNFKLV